MEPLTTLTALATVFPVTLNLLDRFYPIKKQENLGDCTHLDPGFEKPVVTEDIFNMLSWRSRISDYAGRDETLAELIEWANTDKNPISLKFITGPGGVGKSRLAAELAQMLIKADKWEAGFYHLDDPWDAPLGEVGTLFIIDYPEQNPEKVDDVLRVLATLPKNGLPKNYRLRILFLTRTSPAEWEERIDDAGASGKLDQSVPLQPLEISEADALNICRSAAHKAFAWVNGEDKPIPSQLNFSQAEVTDWMGKDAQGFRRRPLFLVAAGIHAALFPDKRPLSLSGPEIIMSLVRRETKRIRAASKSSGASRDTLGHILAMATIAGSLTWTNIQGLDATLKKNMGIPDPWDGRGTLREAGLLRGETFPAVQPDIVGAGFVSQTFGKNAHSAPELIRQAILHAPNETWMENICRIGSDMSLELGTGPTPAKRLADHLSTMEEWDEQLAFLTDVHPPHGMATLCAAACENSLNCHTVDQPEQARLLNNASSHYADAGDTEKAIDAIKKAIKIYEPLAKQFPQGFKLKLATCLNNASNYYAAEGNTTKAIDVIEKAIKIREHFAKQFPQSFSPELANSLNNASNRYADAGDTKKAIDAIEKAIKTYKPLAEQFPEEFSPKLATILNNASSCYAVEGDTKRAIDAIEKAIKIREHFAKQFPQRFRPALATSLYVRGCIHAQTSNKPLAIKDFKQAIALLEPFAIQYPHSKPGQRYRQAQHDLADLENMEE
ncbi:tetratricopeptide repeat protein [Pseudodesulfovibrio sp.]|uniref:tetratricopeptide repeat protein n=1 Tax=unclassified Pseudodesulfovibrio TaxID=2661612 RepID=UPI003B00B005